MIGIIEKTGQPLDLGGSKNDGTPKSSILIGFSIINHPFWGTPIFGNTHFLPTGLPPAWVKNFHSKNLALRNIWPWKRWSWWMQRLVLWRTLKEPPGDAVVDVQGVLAVWYTPEN